MATVEVAFTPLPAHVRTARLVATAVARRSGVDEELLDEVRLAVGEACSRAVEAHRRHCPAEPIRIEMSDLGERFEVIVRDAVPSSPSQPVSANGAAHQPATTGASFPAGFGLAVISGLADDVRISATGTGVSVRMTWPVVVPASSLTRVVWGDGSPQIKRDFAPLARNETSVTDVYHNCHDKVSKLLGMAAGS